MIKEKRTISETISINRKKNRKFTERRMRQETQETKDFEKQTKRKLKESPEDAPQIRKKDEELTIGRE